MLSFSKLFVPGVRHEIRPIRMRYLISSLRDQEHQSGEVSLPKISSLTKSVPFLFFRLKFVSKLEEQIGLMMVRLLLKLKHLFAFVAISKVTTSRLPPCCFDR